MTRERTREEICEDFDEVHKPMYALECLLKQPDVSAAVKWMAGGDMVDDLTHDANEGLVKLGQYLQQLQNQGGSR